MSNASVPLPHTEDLQNSSTQSLVEKAKAVAEVATELIGVGHRLYLSNRHKAPKVKVEVEPGTTHQALWDKYSEGVQSDRPVQQTLSVARTALKAGHAPEEVQKILAHDPQAAKVEQQYGAQKAQEYVNTMTRSATHREEQAQQKGQQSQQRKIVRTREQDMSIKP